jgi:hypothetical protein
VLPSSRRVYSSALEGLLEALSEEIVSSGHACSTFVGEQMSRATDEHATGRLGQARLRAPRDWAKGMPLH